MSLVSRSGAIVLPVNPLTTYVRSLGNDRAVANARAMVEAKQREDWLVQGLARRLDRNPAIASPAAARATA